MALQSISSSPSPSPLTATVSRDCNFISIDVSYDGATLYPFTGQLEFEDVDGNSLGGNVNVTIPTQFSITTVVVPVNTLSSTNGIVNIKFYDGTQLYPFVVSEYPVLIHCDIDCCLSKLTNELIDCSCDCAKCSSALAKAQKIFLLIKSAEYALSQAQSVSSSVAAGYILDAHKKYMKAKEVCDNSCGCDC